MSNTAASPSPDFREAALWSDERHHCLVPIGDAGVSTMVGGGVARVVSKLEQPVGW